MSNIYKTTAQNPQETWVAHIKETDEVKYIFSEDYSIKGDLVINNASITSIECSDSKYHMLIGYFPLESYDDGTGNLVYISNINQYFNYIKFNGEAIDFTNCAVEYWSSSGEGGSVISPINSDGSFSVENCSGNSYSTKLISKDSYDSAQTTSYNEIIINSKFLFFTSISGDSCYINEDINTTFDNDINVYIKDIIFANQKAVNKTYNLLYIDNRYIWLNYGICYTSISGTCTVGNKKYTSDKDGYEVEIATYEENDPIYINLVSNVS